MIHLKYKCKVNFVKLPLIWIYRCLKLVFENATAACNTDCRSVVNRASSFSSLLLMTSAASIVSTWHTSCYTRFTRGHVRELKNAHNSVTVQNQTHVYMNFFDHKNLGNHLLQLRPKVVKHHVYIAGAYCLNKQSVIFVCLQYFLIKITKSGYFSLSSLVLSNSWSCTDN